MSEYIAERRMIASGDGVLAAVSGGADSMCMLSLLIRYAKEHDCHVGAVTIDHGFRPEAAEEANYVAEFCLSHNIPYFTERIETGSIARSEEAARIRRYELIGEIASAHGYERIALAHNMQDNAETMLFNLFRGSGLSGMCGISPARDIYIRPILCLDRVDIETYLQNEGIRYYTDSTNLEDDYSRNRIRHHILPEARGINPQAVRHMNDTAYELSDIRDYISGQARDVYMEVVSDVTHRDGDRGDRLGDMCLRVGHDGRVIDTERYLTLPKVIRMELLRMALCDMTPHLKDISREHILTLDRLIGSDKPARADLPYGIRAYKEYDRLTIIKDENAAGACRDSDDVGTSLADGAEIEIDISGLTADGEALSLPVGEGTELKLRVISNREGDSSVRRDISTAHAMTKFFDYDKINRLLCIRRRKDDDTIMIDAAGHNKPLNRYMIDVKIPKRLRDSIPLLADGDDILWVIGYRDSYAYRISEATTRILEATWRQDSQGG